MSLRSLARTVAKNRMRNAGYEKFCKHQSELGRSRINSIFARNWRKVVGWDGVGIQKT